MTTIAERMFGGHEAESELKLRLVRAGVTFVKIGWDQYDSSIELHGVPNDYRLSVAAQRIIHAAGFAKIYVNHVDKWETHYGFNPREEFVEAKGWRVSYPHKRSSNAKGIWVEEVCESWPKDWFETGYCIVRPPSTDDGTKPPFSPETNLNLSERKGG